MRLRTGLWILVGMMVLAAAVVAQVSRKGESIIVDFRNGLQLGGSTTLTGASGTGNSAVVLPANSVGFGGEIAGYTEKVSFCGDLVNGSSSPATTYFGPGVAEVDGTPTDYVIAGSACNALDSTTEGTADAPLSTLPVKILGFRCKQSAASGASKTTTYTLRTAAADAVTTDGGATTVSCSIAGATATECVTTRGTTTNIAAGATVAIKAVTDADLSSADGRCVVQVAWP